MLTWKEQCEWRESLCGGMGGRKGHMEGKEDGFSGGDSEELQLTLQCPPDMFKDRQTSAER